ncbi:MAG: FAD-binding protein [Rhodobacteraceae bacterium]|nr:FAD-binding protein [Paracoccaceae bacterium]
MIPIKNYCCAASCGVVSRRRVLRIVHGCAFCAWEGLDSRAEGPAVPCAPFTGKRILAVSSGSCGKGGPAVPNTHSISKRTFLKTAGAGVLTSVLPTWRRAAHAAGDAYDLIVIGAGTAGMPAAIFAADRGARVLVIEKSPVLGGTLDRSGGQMSAAGTVFQKRKGIKDTPDAHFEDHMRINHWSSDPMVTRLFVDNAGESLNWLAANGFEVLDNHPVKGAGHEFFTTARYQWGKDNGKSILAVTEPLFRKAMAEGKIDLKLDTGAVDLVQDGTGAVVGVTAESDTGTLTDYMGKNVLLASGGCASNPRMFYDMHGVALASQVAYPYSQGAGFVLGQGAGGFLRYGEKYIGTFGGLLSDDNFPATLEGSFEHHPNIRPPWEIYVNANGERFMCEDNPSIDYRERSLLHQPGERMWVVADQDMIEKAPEWIPRWSKEKFMDSFGSHPMFAKAESLTALAAKVGIPGSMLAGTVKSYNASINEGLPDAFGRQHRPAQLKRGPFYAVRFTAWQLKSFAGLAIDAKLRVIRPDGSHIPGLFGAGEVIGGGATGGNAYTNGSMVTPAVTFGRLVGQRMAVFGT